MKPDATPSDARHELAYGDQRVPYTLVRSDRATLEVAVRPDGSVWVRSPLDASDQAVRAALTRRARWIVRQRDRAGARLAEGARRYVSGATHRYLGRQYRLRVSAGVARERVRLRGGFFWVEVPELGEASVARALAGWYRQRAGATFARRMDACLAAVRPHGAVPAPDWSVRSMRARWGSHTASGRLFLNPDLVRAPLACVDYVIVHELCHGLHAHHGPAFYHTLSRARPSWREDKARLDGRVW